MLGLRGFPDVQGGVETHCENLCPELVNQGCEVTVLTRSPYTNQMQSYDWHGIHFKRLWAPRSKGLEAIAHTFLGVMYAATKRPDILHIQAIGPAIWTPLARMFGLHVVVTHHGPDYDRQKWGKFAKFVLRTGERFGMRYANDRIVISETIQNIIQNKYGLDSVRVPNGVILPDLNTSFELLKEFNLISNRYILLVSRLVKEKRHLDLIEAFKQCGLEDWKLVIVGDSDHPDEYVKQVKEAAAATTGVIMTGYQSGDALKALYQHAGIFVLPSSHEGLPIALLE
ncbi:MAG: glycosyltransferase family 4 protein, partial [Candidatus Thiodiazotropha sp. (ex Lucinoma kastoroae)]|nr:glycosyltransferase family 4 protein [Candidatus Thiodiazotropha sp. (ex Lucinoma kastoroae)]